MKSGNSKTFKFQKDGQTFYSKSFENTRLFEFYNEYFCSLNISQLGKNLTTNIHAVDKENLIIYFEYIDKKPDFNICNFLKYISLIQKIHRLSCKNNEYKIFAKEAQKSNKYFINNLEERINSHFSQKDNFDKKYEKLISNIKLTFNKIRPLIEDIEIASDYRFNHADSGLHNCVLNENNDLLIVDLEYAGLDSPIKQHIDFMVHPKNISYSFLSDKWSNYFIEELIHKSDKKYLNIYNCLFAIKWSLIILNEFLEEKWKIRVHADHERVNNRAKILTAQLEKAEIYLKAGKKLLDNVEPKSLFTEIERILISKPY